ncbi:POK18 protein, partial [Centropus bengalensis]|nr:POK18 protein [Centropus bengalensis]
QPASGWKISDAQVRPQKIELKTDIRTLHGAQKLLGDLQWVRNMVGITNEDLNPLLVWLQGTEAQAPREC